MTIANNDEVYQRETKIKGKRMANSLEQFEERSLILDLFYKGGEKFIR